MEVVNSDSNLRRHPSVDDPDFSFDSGAQSPGAKADIAFTKAGTSDVLRTIDPKMKLIVTLRE